MIPDLDLKKSNIVHDVHQSIYISTNYLVFISHHKHTIFINLRRIEPFNKVENENILFCTSSSESLPNKLKFVVLDEVISAVKNPNN